MTSEAPELERIAMPTSQRAWFRKLVFGLLLLGVAAWSGCNITNPDDREMSVLSGHSGTITDIAFQNGTMILASASDDNSVRF